MDTAPLHIDVAEAPSAGKAFWVRTRDDKRLRVATWPGRNVSRGTLLIFPGRTEYIEKYGRTVSRLAEKGYATIIVDWRGQGLSDRMALDPRMGHVVRFEDYQLDVETVLRSAETLDLPKPWNLLCHSMGASIGLRAQSTGLPVQTSAFLSPMWALRLPAWKQFAARGLAWAANTKSHAAVYAPSTNAESYVQGQDFQGNRLTQDPNMYAYFINQAQTLTDHQTGGPSLQWLGAALKENGYLSRVAPPTKPTLVLCGADDELIDVAAVRRVANSWTIAQFKLVQYGRHDLLCEAPEIRNRVFDMIDQFFFSSRE